MPKLAVSLLVACLAAGPALAQSSASHVLEEHTFNSGGHPQDGAVPASPGFRLSVHALGQAVQARGLSAPSFILDGGFIGSYPPPGEVVNVRFTGLSTLVWDPEPSTGVYNLYQGNVTDPWDPDYGICVQAGVPSETATVSATPPAGEGIFILVTAENLLAEEGIKGSASGGALRANPVPCP